MSQPKVLEPPTRCPTCLPAPPGGAETLASGSSHYTFGDTSLAAHRLALLAALFEPGSSRLLRRLAYRQPRHILDLGCGPGWSTRLLQTLLASARITGLDQSREQINRAREISPPGIEYRVHDVSHGPLPVPSADFLYCRFLLTHMPEPERVLAGWAAEAAEDAILVVEETADITSPHPAFQRYYQLVAALQAFYGQSLYLGRTLSVGASSGWTTELDLSTARTLPAMRMARLHALNIASWRQDRHARDAFDAAELDAVEQRLLAVANGAESAPDVAHVMRQLVLVRQEQPVCRLSK